ncbi:hypothetical protein SAMN04488021_12817 [Paracoccus aminovorans]|uniref:Cytochrome c domain-containing protein n=1 Tax=Paracoccus aminovorans TaxID=34004 RepID=A0A1I3C686_9RHOB|nr:c-type cytochrome [Paracoccus aminovorans]CQR84485.1 cytochrom C, putative [Paracoccus aminovorans]SFH69933.1 hypothetical protein SAMN04488021_12817 [Paracoccus aminovorans]
MKALLVLALLAAPALAQDGAVIYRHGAGLEARLGRADGPRLPPGRLTCAGCHGADGQGGAEGGTLPAPPVAWSHLAAPAPDRPGYDEAAFIRLLREGITPSGRAISTRMPRFAGTPEAFAALLDHLRALDQAERQGLGPTAVAVALPRDPDARDAALAAMAAFNAEGGAFGRRAAPGEPAFLDLDRVAAALVPRLAAAERARLDRLLRDEPGLRPLTPDAPPPGPLRVAGTLDQIGPRLPALLARPGVEAVAVGPSAEAMLWALREKRDVAAAHAYAAVRVALDMLRDEGRMPTRSGLARRLSAADLSDAVEVYRQEAPAD